MKRVAQILASVALLTNAGCTPILKETRYTGGYPGYLLDRRTFNASASKQLLLLRATLILAMAAEMSRVTVKGDDGDAFAKHLGAATAEINYAAADVYPTSSGAVCLTNDPAPDDSGCSGYYANFEGDIPLIEARIIKVMLAALPTDKARKFLDNVSRGNVLGAAWTALSTVAAGAGGLHFAFGRYRSGLEIVAENMGSRCRAGATGKFDAKTMTVIEAAGCLGLSQDDLFNNPDEADAIAMRGDNPDGVRPRAFLALMRTVAAACIDLPYSGDVGTIARSRNVRGEACNAIGFKPTPRPYRISQTAESTVAGTTSEPATAPIEVAPVPDSGLAPALVPNPSPNPAPNL